MYDCSFAIIVFIRYRVIAYVKSVMYRAADWWRRAPLSASELQSRSPTKCKFGLSGFRSFVLIYRAVLEWQYVEHVEVRAQ